MAADEPLDEFSTEDSEPLPPATSLAELIEIERGELMQIHAICRCLNDVLLYADDDDSPMHAEVALVIARLLDESMVRLELVRIRVAHLEAAAQESVLPATPPYQVREERATYMC